MVIDESSRHAMFTRLQEVLGKEHARVLMEHLPPIGWADVATKSDLAALEARLDFRLEAMKQALTAEFRGEMNSQTRTIVTWLIAGMGASTAAAVAALVVAARGLS